MTASLKEEGSWHSSGGMGDQVGGDRLEVVVENPAQLDTAAQALRSVAHVMAAESAALLQAFFRERRHPHRAQGSPS